MSKNFYSLLDTPKTQESPIGQDVYEWVFLDKVGNLKADTKDVYQEIQSYKNSVDYKKKIEQGEIFENGNGLYMDTRKFDGDYNDVSRYFADLASRLRSQVAQDNRAVDGTSGSEASSTIAKVVKESGGDASGSGQVGATSGNGQGGDGK